MNKLNQISAAILRNPILWGLILSGTFYAALWSGHISHPGIKRYLDDHWIEHLETAMFCTGLAALVIKFMQIRSQLGLVRHDLLDVVPVGTQQVADCPGLLAQLDELPAKWQESYQVRRMRDLIQSVYRKNTADELDADIKYYSDLDAGRAAHSYAFMRLIIWALPILGLLGTVIGMTMVLANLDPKNLDATLPIVFGGLGTAFDTTAVALGFSMTLMFVQYFVDRQENYLLSMVDERVNIELSGRFEVTDNKFGTSDTGTLRRLAETLMQTQEKLIARLAELWQGTISAAHSRWESLTAGAGEHLSASMAAALEKSLRTHAEHLTEAEQKVAAAARQQWKELQQALVRNVECATAQQQELTKQSEVLLKVVEATGQIGQLEQALNRNLETLSGAKHFEETVLSLAAAVQLLSARTSSSGEVRPVELPRSKRAGQAA